MIFCEKIENEVFFAKNNMRKRQILEFVEFGPVRRGSAPGSDVAEGAKRPDSTRTFGSKMT